MYYADEVRKVEEFRTDNTLIKDKELELARTLIESLAAPLSRRSITTLIAKNLMTMIKAKVEGRELVEAPDGETRPGDRHYGSPEHEPRASEEAGPLDGGICVPGPGRGGCERGEMAARPEKVPQEFNGIGVAGSQREVSRSADFDTTGEWAVECGAEGEYCPVCEVVVCALPPQDMIADDPSHSKKKLPASVPDTGQSRKIR